jgi:hypothetical protein
MTVRDEIFAGVLVGCAVVSGWWLMKDPKD